MKAPYTRAPAVAFETAPVRYGRFRSVASPRAFFLSAALSFGQYLAMLATATLAWRLASNPDAFASLLVLAGVFISASLWLAAHLQRRSARCCLCKGTPLADSGARPHRHAFRLTPLNHGTTAVLSILACQRFRYVLRRELRSAEG